MKNLTNTSYNIRLWKIGWVVSVDGLLWIFVDILERKSRNYFYIHEFILFKYRLQRVVFVNSKERLLSCVIW